MFNWISTLSKYLNKFLELGVLLLAVSVIAEIVFGPNVAFFGSQVTKNLINLLNALGEQGIAVSLLGGNVPFVGEIAGNIISLVQSLGDAGIVGLVAAIIILNLYK